jgi:predicted nucleic acid-binding protein
MAMILDTNAVSALLTGDVALEPVLAASDRHHVPLMVLGEHLFGLLASGKRRRLKLLLDRLEAESIVLYPNRETADHYAAIRHALRKKGRPIPENDIWIAALARQHDLEIVSRDPHFDDVSEIVRVAW